LYYDLSTAEITRKLRELLDKGSRGSTGGLAAGADSASLEKEVIVGQ
jgi:hypothetical protein